MNSAKGGPALAKEGQLVSGSGDGRQSQQGYSVKHFLGKRLRKIPFKALILIESIAHWYSIGLFALRLSATFI